MNISPPPCIAKEEGDILDCYFFAGGNINLDADDQEDCKEDILDCYFFASSNVNLSVMGKMITNS